MVCKPPCTALYLSSWRYAPYPLDMSRNKKILEKKGGVPRELQYLSCFHETSIIPGARSYIRLEYGPVAVEHASLQSVEWRMFHPIKRMLPQHAAQRAHVRDLALSGVINGRKANSVN
ncbi:hypothetical protein P171DRAFT_276114 [Karstenula rhodostoma CBS 690.94]|uniref:Uncharacterized protein n=1 Tax=Karstenula rhodostoma CBS 690.94 TaxID=1392251 RepID=A0A9P4PKW7_9PLEO|nr:hypothetical protein P171DRAFT_276114 [Karstenula rhodostoma CBS 690.94]